MKIIFVIPSLAKGGQEKAGMLLCNFLRNYHDVTAVCFEKEQAGEFNYLVPVVRLADREGQGFFYKFTNGFARILKLKKLKKQYGADLSIAFGNTAIIANWLSSAGERKIVSIRQSFNWILGQKSIMMRLHLALYIKAIKAAHSIVSVSHGINAELLKLNISNNTVIMNGIDLEEIVAKSAVLVNEMKGDKIYISQSGRFDISKGHWYLIRVFVEIKRKCKEAVLLLLGGISSSGMGLEISDYCKDYIKLNGLSWSTDIGGKADIVFLGHQDNPFKFIAKSSLFLHTSVWEGFPNALLEAMACAVPVVATDCPTGPAELLKDEAGENFGLLLPPLSTNFDPLNFTPTEEEVSAASQITQLLLNKDDLAFYAKKSAIRAAQFSFVNTGKKWLKVIENSEVNI